MLYFEEVFISDDITCFNWCYLLLLPKIRKTFSIKKMDKNNELKKVSSKSRTCYYFDDTHKHENFDCKKISVVENLSR